MNPTPLSRIAQWAGGRLLAGSADALVTTVCTDSRALKPGCLFAALRGDNFDGHQFVADAAKHGAVGAIVEKAPLDLPPGFGVIEVLDSLRGLQALGASYRASLPVKVIGITGSNGKTSTKDATASVLGRRFRTAKTEGNLNNHIGVPLTLLQLDSSHEMAVVEMGMNHAGELEPLAKIARPDAAIITNVGLAHIEFLRTREAIAREKSVVAEAVPASGTVILNADDDFTPFIAERCRGRVVTAGISRGDVRATDLQPLSSGTRFRVHATGQSVDAELPVPGEHMVRNALLACATGLAFGLTLEECAAGLAAIQLSKGRLQQKRVGGLLVLDDSYNANPDSVIAGLITLVQMPGGGRRIAVLGRMGELGHEAERGHRKVGEKAGELGLSCLITVGDEAHWIADSAQGAGLRDVRHVATADEAAKALREMAHEGDIALLKGSRSAKMERVLQVLEALEKGGAA
jgi:UDP-N-acetylmuramoyl-tripeptide--D-alanyl-D-alanine ligase